MRKKSEIGSLIRQGKTSKEIRKIINNFPKEPITIQYFLDLGYKKSTSVQLLRQLNINDEKKIKKVKKQKAFIKSKKNSNDYTYSENANFKNIILDTSALGYVECCKLLEEAKSITIIYRTIIEFDDKKNFKSTSFDKNNLAYNIRKYSKEFLTDKRVRLVPFGRNMESKYHDEVLLQYMIDLPVNERMTLLTVDVQLALKAKALGLDYILYIPRIKSESEKISTSQKEKEDEIVIEDSKEQRFGESDNKEPVVNGKKFNAFGIDFRVCDDKIFINRTHNRAYIYYTKQEKTEQLTSNEIACEEFDEIIVVVYTKNLEFKVDFLWIEEGNIMYGTEQYDCFTDVEGSDLPEIVKEDFRNNLL